MAGEPIFEMEFNAMADEDGDVIVSLPGDTGAVITKAADAVVVKTGTAAPAAGTEDPIDDLKSQFATMSRRASVAEQATQQATQQAQEATQRVQHLEGEVVRGQLDTVLSGIAAADAEVAAAEQAFVTASEAGDFAAQARANRTIAGAEARKQRLLEAKDDLEDAAKRKPAPAQPQRQAAPARTEVTDPIERLIVDGNISGKSAAWLRSHPEVADPKINARMMAAHNLAVADDIQLESEEYFRRIEEGIKPGAKKVAQDQPRAGTRPSSAAASGGAASGGLNGGTEVRLTKGEAEAATDGVTHVWNYPDPTGQNRWIKGQAIGLAEMARRKHEGMKAGLYDKKAGEA